LTPGGINGASLTESFFIFEGVFQNHPDSFESALWLWRNGRCRGWFKADRRNFETFKWRNSLRE
jgi:hypothetical protein